MACPYAHILGVPGDGVHARRVYGLALNDIVATLIFAIIVAVVFRVSFIRVFVSIFIIGEILHYIFGTQTAFLTGLGIRAC